MNKKTTLHHATISFNTKTIIKIKPELHIEKMTVSEKLDTMGKLWDSLTKVPEEFPSPLWHKTILEKRHKDAQKIPHTFIDFEEAKKALIDILE